MTHPRTVLLDAQGATGLLPVCDHYCGVEARMTKSLQLQAAMAEEFGACVFDVTLDCEDGAPVGGEVEQAQLVVAMANQAHARNQSVPARQRQRVGARVHPVDHPFFALDMAVIAGQAAHALSYIMVPKVESLADVETAVAVMDAAVFRGAGSGTAAGSWSGSGALPLHVLIESPAAVHAAHQIAAHPRVQSVSFGLMDFVSSHAGAIGSQAMSVRAADDNATLDQFHHPLVVRAKLEIASACHAWGKVPSHCVVTEFRDAQAVQRAASCAAQALGYTRMWSIHPDQIRPILRAFAPAQAEVELAASILEAAAAQDWAPISMAGKLHDRASFRYFWQVLERAHQTGCSLPEAVQIWFGDLPADPPTH